MSGFAPKFCPTHMKIHVCELQNVFNQNKSIEDDLGAKVRRLHGTQTEEEVIQEQSKLKHPPGSIGDILEKAKKQINKQKEKMKEQSSEGKVATGEEINDRLAALRSKISANQDSEPVSNQKKKTKPKKVELTGIEKVIENAKNFQKENDIPDYKVPTRSNRGEKKVYKDMPKGNKPSSVLKDLDLEAITEQDVVAQSPSKPKVKKTTSKPKTVNEKKVLNDDKIFNHEETQELIQAAVKEALKQVGFIDEDENISKKAKKNKSEQKNDEV